MRMNPRYNQHDETGRYPKRDAPAVIDASLVPAVDLQNLKVPVDLRPMWRVFMEDSRESDAMRRAVYRAVVLNLTWKAAAESEGLVLSTVWSVARRWHLARRQHKELIDANARIMTLSSELIEERLLAQPDLEELPTRDLALLHKAVADGYERQMDRMVEETDYASQLDRIAADLIKAGGGTLTLTVTPADPSKQAIDVTPSSEPTSDR